MGIQMRASCLQTLHVLPKVMPTSHHAILAEAPSFGLNPLNTALTARIVSAIDRGAFPHVYLGVVAFVQSLIDSIAQSPRHVVWGQLPVVVVVAWLQ